MGMADFVAGALMERPQQWEKLREGRLPPSDEHQEEHLNASTDQSTGSKQRNTPDSLWCPQNDERHVPLVPSDQAVSNGDSSRVEQPSLEPNSHQSILTTDNAPDPQHLDHWYHDEDVPSGQPPDSFSTRSAKINPDASSEEQGRHLPQQFAGAFSQQESNATKVCTAFP